MQGIENGSAPKALDSEERPWGSWHVIDVDHGYKVKRIHVKPGCRLSYQTHDHRSEHWVVVFGIATCIVDGETITAGPGHSIDVPQGAKHRLCNESSEELVIIEVQRGAYTGEDDIQRFEDDYGRESASAVGDDKSLLTPEDRSVRVSSVAMQSMYESRIGGSLDWEERPWGSWHVIDVDRGYKVKRIHVKPGCRLSYQTHDHRSEHWVVVFGIATCVVGGETMTAGPGHSIDVPQGAKHRLCNEASEELVIIEVQRGAYTGEDDIHRIEDDYGRQTAPDPGQP